MWKVRTALLLVIAYFVYSSFIYTAATEVVLPDETVVAQAHEGKMLFQKYNCAACHQVYGLGGYLGPDLTTVAQKYPNETYIRSLLSTGNQTMPAYHFSDAEKDALIAYFKHLNNYAPHK